MTQPLRDLIRHLSTNADDLYTVQHALVIEEARRLKRASIPYLTTMIMTGDWPCDATLLDAEEAAGRALRVWDKSLPLFASPGTILMKAREVIKNPTCPA